MWTQRVVRTVALSALVTLLGVPALVGVAGADNTPPPQPAPPHTVQSCVDTYTTTQARIQATFLADVHFVFQQQLSHDDTVVGIIIVLTKAQVSLDQAIAAALNCASTATGGPVVRATSMSSRRTHGHGSATTAEGCVNTFNNAIQNASRAQSRSLKRKRHPASLTTATATFGAAFKTAHDRLVTCLNNSTA